MCWGVGKSGSPISRWITSFPWASKARARTSTSTADSVPIRDILSASFIIVQSLLFSKKRNTVPGAGFDDAIVDNDALAVHAGRDAAATIQLHDDDLVRHIRREPFGCEINNGVGIDDAGS